MCDFMDNRPNSTNIKSTIFQKPLIYQGSSPTKHSISMYSPLFLPLQVETKGIFKRQGTKSVGNTDTADEKISAMLEVIPDILKDDGYPDVTVHEPAVKNWLDSNSYRIIKPIGLPFYNHDDDKQQVTFTQSFRHNLLS